MTSFIDLADLMDWRLAIEKRGSEMNNGTQMTIDALTAENIRLRAEVERLREALEFYRNSEVYKPHQHGPAFDPRDLSFIARAALPEGQS